MIFFPCFSIVVVLISQPSVWTHFQGEIKMQNAVVDERHQTAPKKRKSPPATTTPTPMTPINSALNQRSLTPKRREPIIDQRSSTPSFGTRNNDQKETKKIYRLCGLTFKARSKCKMQSTMSSSDSESTCSDLTDASVKSIASLPVIQDLDIIMATRQKQRSQTETK